ncbi:MAG TPA: hypothetical protein VGK35_01295 [Actinotalea sp.]|jgi:hypothetical protein
MSEPVGPATVSRPARTSLLRSPWAVPAVVAVAVTAAFVAPQLASAGDSGLPTITPEQLAVEVATSAPTPLSGTVVYTARLGLPELPFGEATGADPIALLGGSSTLRVWTDGTERSRVALLGSMSEYSVVRDGAQAWTYSSADDEVVHYSLSPADQARYDAMVAAAKAGQLPVTGDLPTPQEAAHAALARADQFSTVSMDAQTTVAGRSAYQLVVTPKSKATLVSRIAVAVDATTKTPLRVQVWSTADTTTPALEVGFTDISFATPDAAVLRFSAPAGASSREVVVPLPKADDTQKPLAGADGALPPDVKVSGSGWDTVVELSGVDVTSLIAGDPKALADVPAAGRIIGSPQAQDLVGQFMRDKSNAASAGSLDATALYGQLTTAVPEGRLLSSTLLSVLITDDGRVLIGAVPADALREMA